MIYPRVLLVSSSVFNSYTGGGVMLTNLFKGWPKDRIAIVHNDNIEPDDRVCKKFYKLSHEEIGWVWPFSPLQNSQSLGLSEPLVSKNHSNIPITSRWTSESFLKRLFGEIPRKANISKQLSQWIDEFKPDLIYTLLGNLYYIRLVRKLSEIFQIPVTIHIMDDWLFTLYRNGLFNFYLSSCMHHEFRELLKKASLRMGICESMCKEYENRYACSFIPIQNAIESSRWLKELREGWMVHQPHRVVYAGAVLPKSQLYSLMDVCEAIADLHASGMNVEMRLYCPWFYAERYRRNLERISSVRLFDAPEESNISSLFVNADVLVLPVNFDKSSAQYVRYSMPAKVPAYMMSGTPILVYGPKEVASVQYALKDGWGYVVSKKSIPDLKKAICTLMTDIDLRIELGKRSQKLALRNHDAARVRDEFREALAKAAASYSP